MIRLCLNAMLNAVDFSGATSSAVFTSAYPTDSDGKKLDSVVVEIAVRPNGATNNYTSRYFEIVRVRKTLAEVKDGGIVVDTVVERDMSAVPPM